MAQHIRRKPRELPSVRKHGLGAILLLATIGIPAVSWLNISAKNHPISHTITEISLPEPLDLNATNNVPRLPDLLEPDNIPQDVNPTAPVNMVGGPDKSVTPDEAVTPDKPDALKNTPSGQVLIDGKAITSNQQTITNYTPLPLAPLQGFSRMTSYGPIPQPHKDSRTVVTAYAKPFTAKTKTKYISLVVGGLGFNPILTRKAINNLPDMVTLAFAAEAPGLQGWINLARAHGHEVMIELPMQGSHPVEERTLTLAGPDTTNIQNLEYLLSRAQGYFAVTNYNGSRLVNNETALLPIIQILKRAGLGFIYDGAIANARITPLARREGLPIVNASAYLDVKQQDSIYVHRNIKALIKDGYDNVPIGMGFAYPGTIDGIKTWLATKPKNIELAPVSYALKSR